LFLSPETWMPCPQIQDGNGNFLHLQAVWRDRVRLTRRHKLTLNASGVTEARQSNDGHGTATAAQQAAHHRIEAVEPALRHALADAGR